jgi:hypothetical protein
LAISSRLCASHDDLEFEYNHPGALWKPLSHFNCVHHPGFEILCGQQPARTTNVLQKDNMDNDTLRQRLSRLGNSLDPILTSCLLECDDIYASAKIMDQYMNQDIHKLLDQVMKEQISRQAAKQNAQDGGSTVTS